MNIKDIKYLPRKITVIMYNFSNFWKKFKKPIITIFICFLLSLIYLVGNYYLDNILLDFVVNSLLIQSLFIFSTVISLVNIWTPTILKKNEIENVK